MPNISKQFLRIPVVSRQRDLTTFSHNIVTKGACKFLDGIKTFSVKNTTITYTKPKAYLFALRNGGKCASPNEMLITTCGNEDCVHEKHLILGPRKSKKYSNSRKNFTTESLDKLLARKWI